MLINGNIQMVFGILRLLASSSQLIQNYAGYDLAVLIYRGADKEGNKLQQQKILIFIYPSYNHNWRNISNIYIYI